MYWSLKFVLLFLQLMQGRLPEGFSPVITKGCRCPKRPTAVPFPSARGCSLGPLGALAGSVLLACLMWQWAQPI